MKVTKTPPISHVKFCNFSCHIYIYIYICNSNSFPIPELMKAIISPLYETMIQMKLTELAIFTSALQYDHIRLVFSV